VKKTLRITILLSIVSLSAGSVFAAPTGGVPRPPQVSFWSHVVNAALALLGM